MSVDILGTNCGQCLSMGQCCFTSTETVRLLRTESPGRPPHIVPELSSLHNYALSMFHKTGCRHSRVTVSTAWTSFLVSSPPPPYNPPPPTHRPPTAHLSHTDTTAHHQKCVSLRDTHVVLLPESLHRTLSYFQISSSSQGSHFKLALFFFLPFFL